jgi:hypothetical protein
MSINVFVTLTAKRTNKEIIIKMLNWYYYKQESEEA